MSTHPPVHIKHDVDLTMNEVNEVCCRDLFFSVCVYESWLSSFVVQLALSTTRANHEPIRYRHSL